MKKSTKIVATALAAALTTSTFAARSSAVPACGPSYPTLFAFVPPVCPTPSTSGGSSAAPWFLGCIFGSAFGLISASYLKKTGQLTTQEAQSIAFSCGIAAVPVIASFNRN